MNNNGNVIEMRLVKTSELPALIAELTGQDIVGTSKDPLSGPIVSDAATVCEMLADAVEHDDPIKIDLEQGLIKMRDGAVIQVPKFKPMGTQLVTGQVRTATFKGSDDSNLAVTARNGRLIALTDGELEVNLFELYQKRQAEKEKQAQNSAVDAASYGETLTQQEPEAETKVIYKLHGRPIEIGQLLFVVTERVFLSRVYDADENGNIISALVRSEFDGPHDDPTHIPAENLLFRPITQATLEKCRNAAPKLPRARYRFTLANLGSFVTEELYDNDKHLIRTLKDRGIDAAMGLSNIERLTETETW